jgi:hypothetical protein
LPEHCPCGGPAVKEKFKPQYQEESSAGRSCGSSM